MLIIHYLALGMTIYVLTIAIIAIALGSVWNLTHRSWMMKMKFLTTPQKEDNQKLQNVMLLNQTIMKQINMWKVMNYLKEYNTYVEASNYPVIVIKLHTINATKGEY